MHPPNNLIGLVFSRPAQRLASEQMAIRQGAREKGFHLIH